MGQLWRNMSIAVNLLSLLRDPVGLDPLELDGDALVNQIDQRRYPIRNSIPVLLDLVELGPQNRKIQRMYQWMAYGFDLADRVGNWLTRGGLTRFRRELACRLALKPGDRVLYT